MEDLEFSISIVSILILMELLSEPMTSSLQNIDEILVSILILMELLSEHREGFCKFW